MAAEGDQIVRTEATAGGLKRLVIDAAPAQAHIYRHGAHVTHFQPRGQAPVLWLSSRSRFESNRPIRGGVPICFPWFGPRPGDPAAPQHGPARLREWDLLATDTLDNGSVRIAMALDIEPFTITHTVTVGQALVLRLDVYNGGTAPATFEAALHPYLAVGDVRQVRLRGLAGARYIDKVAGGRRQVQADEPLSITGEIDRVYLDTDQSVELHDPVLRRVVTVDKSGSLTTIVWNPGPEKARKLTDFPDDQWPHMLCLETACAADNAITLPPRRSHTMTATISVEPTA
jgi:glucose-6-phosphate 1-epimerase